MIEGGAGVVGHDAAHDPAEAINGGGAGVAIRSGEDFALTFEEAALESFAGFGQGEMALTAVSSAAGLGDIIVFHQRGQNAGEALLGDAKNRQEFTDGDAGTATDKVDGAVMGAAEAEFFQYGVGGRGEIPVGEEEKILSLPHLFLTEEEMAGAGWWFGVERAHARSPRVRTATAQGSHAGKLGQSCCHIIGIILFIALSKQLYCVR